MQDSQIATQLMKLNLELALERVGGDRELLQEVAGLFLADAPRMMGLIEKAIAEGDAKLLEREAHSLKGSVANFGADQVAKAALHLENLGRRGELSAAPAGFATLRDSLSELEPELARLVSA